MRTVKNQTDNSRFKEAKAFRDAYGLTDFDKALQMRLIKEEYQEFLDEMDRPTERPKKALKELADLVFTCYQFAAARGWNLDVAMARLSESNLSKLDIDGQPIKDADGKIMKGPRYQEPQLDDLV